MGAPAFTFDGYAQLIALIQQMGYPLCGYHDCQDKARACILRHDVDFDLTRAARFAAYEAELGVRSTYFLLLRTSFYNVFSQDAQAAIRRIQQCGHTIGLHFDEACHPGCTPASLPDRIAHEGALLSDAIGQPVTSVSMHRPSQAVLGADLSVPGMVNSYGTAFFRGYKYLSDSRMHWCEDPLSAIKSGTHTHLHILTHPFWYHETELPPEAILRRFLSQATQQRYAALKDNIRDLNEFLTMEETQDASI